MSQPFLEEQLPGCIRYGSSWQDDYSVRIVQTADGSEYRTLVHPFPVRRFSVFYTKEKSRLWDEIVSFYHRCYGRFAGFRVRAEDDFSTNGTTGTPTAWDQELELVSAGVYQLRKEYGTGANGLPIIGRPWRTIFKPVSGTVRVGIRNPITGDFESTAFTVDTTTGRVSFAANKNRAITNITQASQAVITVGANTYINGEQVHISGVEGMTEINGMRATIVGRTSTDITVDIDTTGFSAYTSGGEVNTQPQAGEDIYGGCLFDLPCRFDSPLDVTPVSPELRETGVLEIVELLKP